MIELQTKFVTSEISELDALGPTASVTNFRGGYAADVMIMFRNLELHEPFFAGLHYNIAARKSLPAIDVGRWKDVLILVGAKKWLLVGLSDAGGVVSVALHREDNEDPGFYSFSFYELSGLLVVVYESGVFAVSDDCHVVWHRKKHWDDILVATHDDYLVFAPFEGDDFAISSRTGLDWIDD